MTGTSNHADNTSQTFVPVSGSPGRYRCPNGKKIANIFLDFASSVSLRSELRHLPEVNDAPHAMPSRTDLNRTELTTSALLAQCGG